MSQNFRDRAILKVFHLFSLPMYSPKIRTRLVHKILGSYSQFCTTTGSHKFSWVTTITLLRGLLRAGKGLSQTLWSIYTEIRLICGLPYELKGILQEPAVKYTQCSTLL